MKYHGSTKLTKEMIEEYINVKDSVSRDEIAKHFNVSINTVANCIKRHNIYVKFRSFSLIRTILTKQLIELYIETKNERVSCGGMARHFRVGFNIMSKYLYRYDLQGTLDSHNKSISKNDYSCSISLNVTEEQKKYIHQISNRLGVKKSVIIRKALSEFIEREGR
jgi:transposase